MNKTPIFLLSFLFFSLNGYCQFNTILPKEKENKVEPKLATAETIIEKEEAKPIINDSINERKKHLLNTRRYLSLPIDSLVITSNFGMRKHPISGEMKEHKGIDFKANNDYVYAIMAGKIKKVGKDKKLGNYIEVEHGDFTTIYGHLYSFLVNTKQSVEAGQPIGITGNTGQSTGEHLHFAMKYDGKFINPSPILKYINELINFVRVELASHRDND